VAACDFGAPIAAARSDTRRNPLRFLGIGGMPNLRDVGGYALTSGGATRWAVLYRAGAPGLLTPSGRQQFDDLGLQCVVDLREQAEIDSLPSPPSSAQVHQIPLYRSRIVLEDVEDLESVYRDTVHVCGDSIAAVCNRLGEPDALPALIHCCAGKDRTGMVIAIILSAVGVPDELVAQDYGRTAEIFTGEYRERLLAQSAVIGIDPQRIALLSGSPPALMRTILVKLVEEYGGAAAYLTHHGATPEALQTLRDALTLHP
jgi:protein-tyrosine phosphatase